MHVPITPLCRSRKPCRSRNPLSLVPPVTPCPCPQVVARHPTSAHLVSAVLPLVAAVLPLYTGSRRTPGEPRDARAYGVGYGLSTSCRAERDNPTMSTSTSPADGQRSIAPSSRDAEAVSTRTRGRHSCSALRGELEGRPATAAARTSKVDSARRQERPRSSRSGGAALLTVTELFEMGESRHFDARAPRQYLAPQRQHP